MQLLIQAVGLLADMVNANDLDLSSLCRPFVRVVPIQELVPGMEMVLGEGLGIGFQIPAWDRLAGLPINPLRT